MFVGSRILYTVRVNDDITMQCQEHRPAAGDHFNTGDHVSLSWESDAIVALSDRA